MIRVYIVVEGASEEAFVNAVLAPDLWPADVYLTPIVIGPPGSRGGRVTLDRVVDHLTLLLKQELGVYCTTLIDYYGRGSGWPPIPAHLPAAAAAALLEQAVAGRLSAALPDQRTEVRCLPYVQLHEFEALLFSDATAFAHAIGRPDLVAAFVAVRQAVATPEDIDDGPATAPSKRLLAVHPRYRKVIEGQQAATAIGVAAMRRACPRFDQWVARLLTLPDLSGVSAR